MEICISLLDLAMVRREVRGYKRNARCPDIESHCDTTFVCDDVSEACWDGARANLRDEGKEGGMDENC